MLNYFESRGALTFFLDFREVEVGAMRIELGDFRNSKGKGNEERERNEAGRMMRT